MVRACCRFPIYLGDLAEADPRYVTDVRIAGAQGRAPLGRKAVKSESALTSNLPDTLAHVAER